MPVSGTQLVKNKMAPFPGFQGITLAELSKPLLRQWKLWMAENGTSGRMINGALLALRVPVSWEFLWEALRSELAGIGITEEERVRRNIVFHSLRHSFVTAMRIAGFSDFEVMSMGRHKDVKMLQRYSHGQEALDLLSMKERMDTRLPAPAGVTR